MQDPAEAEQEHQQMVGELRGVMDQFSAYCLTVLNSSDSNNSQIKGLNLTAATHLNDIGTVRCLLENYDRSYEEYGPIAAMQAAGSGYIEIVQLLFERASHWFDSKKSKTGFLPYPFHLAAINNQREIVAYLLPQTPAEIINASGKEMPIGSFPPLLVGLVKCNCLDVLRLILERKPDLEIRSSEGHTPLSQACSNCNYEIAEILIAAGAKVDVSATISKGQDPKKSAIAKTSANPLANLLDVIKGEQGISTTPLEYAAANGHVRLVYLLLKSGAKVNVAPSMLGTALMLASRASPLNPSLKHFRRDFPNVVRLLLMHGAMVDQRHPFSNETALLSACMYNQNEIVRQLLLAGADVYIESNMGEKITAYLDKMSIEWRQKTSPSQKTAAILLRAQKQRHEQQVEEEKKLRNELINALSSGKYNSDVDKKGSDPKLESVPQNESGKSVATTKKKKKKKKNKKNRANTEKDNNAVSQPAQSVLKASDPVSDSTIVPLAPEAPLNITEHSSAITFSSNSALITNDLESTAAIKSTADEQHDSRPDSNVKNSIGDSSVAITKQAIKAPQPVVAIAIPKAIFDNNIPTGDKLRTFPLRLAGVSHVFYFVALVPDELNKQFDRSRLPQLKKMWAAILTERLLPAKSKDTAGVKCLAAIEMSKLKGTFFKKATHKVKHPRENTRVYLQSTLPKNGAVNEIHLELIGPDFRAH